ncbi:MAG: hypothetical protein ACKVS6_11965 [Planctomycetota bacterium]
MKTTKREAFWWLFVAAIPVLTVLFAWNIWMMARADEPSLGMFLAKR